LPIRNRFAAWRAGAIFAMTVTVRRSIAGDDYGAP